MTIQAPLFIVLPRKTKSDRKLYLNLNNYRNWHYQISNQAKGCFCDALRFDLSGLILQTPIRLHFTLFKGSQRKIDRSNILSIIEKFFCDSLVAYGCIPDDNDNYIESTHYRTGGIDKLNPRCEIIIETADNSI